MVWMVLNILTRNALSGMTTDLERNFVMGLRELRLKRGMTQQHVAAYENGVNSISNMTLAKALRMCDALHVANPRKLLDDDDK